MDRPLQVIVSKQTVIEAEGIGAVTVNTAGDDDLMLSIEQGGGRVIGPLPRRMAVALYRAIGDHLDA